VGEHIAGLIATHMTTLDNIYKTTYDDLLSIEGIGPVVADSVSAFFKNIKNIAIINRMIQSGVCVVFDTLVNKTELAGKLFVLTGSLETLNRSQAKQLIEMAGAQLKSSVSISTDYIVVGSTTGSKLDRAKALIFRLSMKQLSGR
jgi:DNA ligase (NAD+)